MNFTEAQLESAIIELLEAEGYPHVPLGERSSSSVGSDLDAAGATSLPGVPGVLIKADLRALLAKQYAGDHITPQEIEAVIEQKLVKLDPSAPNARKFARYLPIWA